MNKILKRIFDLILAFLVIFLTLPIWATVALVVRLVMGAPIIFKQQRAGFYGNPFILYKFRSMTNMRSPSGVLMADEERLTRLGRFLRQTSWDELPSLINVLRGDMSLIGPRPLLMQYLDRYTTKQARRHEVKPGITGWAQINGRNAISWEEKLNLDIWYVDNQSFCLDLKILLKTVYKVFCCHGINQKGHATVQEFMGCSKNE